MGEVDMVKTRVNKDCQLIGIEFERHLDSGYIQLTQYGNFMTEFTISRPTQKDIDVIIAGLQELRQYVKEG